jgi:aldose sugar dehydrogenase
MLRNYLPTALTLLFILISQFAYATRATYDVVKPTLKIRSNTVFYKIVATQFELPFLHDSGTSGPFEIINKNQFLFVSRCGLATVAVLNDGGFYVVNQFNLPNANEVFCAGPESNPALIASLPNKLIYGVKGMKLDVARKRLFIDTESISNGNNLIIKIFEYPVTLSPFRIGNAKLIFSTNQQFLGYIDKIRELWRHFRHRDTNETPEIESLVATQAGGSMALDEDGNLYIGVGDLGWYPYAQDDKSPYGKILKYDGHSVTIFAKGVRNPEGLYFDSRTGLLETEHGPKGGDELNEISKGDNLGWPISSYGIDYLDSGEANFIPLVGEEQWGHHDFGKKPLFVYMPAIAPTDLTVVNPQSMFKDWDGSVLIASLRGNSIFRVLLDDYHGMYSEPIINLKQRIRYLRQATDGTLYAKADPDFFYVVQLDWPGIRRNDPEIDSSANIQDLIGQCKGCHIHVAHGGIPNIFGMKPEAIVAALQSLSASSTADPKMVSIAKGLTKDDMKRLAVYFSRAH